MLKCLQIAGCILCIIFCLILLYKTHMNYKKMLKIYDKSKVAFALKNYSDDLIFIKKEPLKEDEKKKEKPFDEKKVIKDCIEQLEVPDDLLFTKKNGKESH